jgi:hypothetical protein
MRATKTQSKSLHRIYGRATAILSSLILTACGGGADTTQQPASTSAAISTYTGPAAATADVQSFMVNVWENVRPQNRCGACHSDSGGQNPMFARGDDVNLAYAAANPLVDLSSPVDSRLVTKVGGGHNCWLSSDTACADIMTTWIEGWAGAAGASGTRQIQLEAPVIQDVGSSKNFPGDSSLFGAVGGIHDLLTTYCAGCHSSAATTPQTPYFADADADVAYEAVKSKINLDDPASSRLVVRLRDEFHNCWDDCASNSAEMQLAIQTYANAIPLTAVDPQLVVSKALKLYDGTIASGGNRHEANQIAFWEFKTGQGFTAFDTSGVNPAIDLTLSGGVSWVGGWGIALTGGKAQGSTIASKKLHDLITATNAYSIEAWVVPGNVTQEDARIVSYSGGTVVRNFNLGQTLYNYDFFNRSNNSDGNGDPALSTADADEDLQATLQHVVMNYDQVNGRSIYVNGVFTDDLDPTVSGTLADWDDTFAFVLGNEVSGDRPWQGSIRMVAIHNRVLAPAEIQQNFDVGVGEKFFLLFFVGDLVNVPDAYIVLEASQFDSYSYLFTEPMFISLDPSAQPNNIDIEGMRLGINGREAPVGQAFANMDTVVSAGSYTPSGQVLSDLGTIISLEKGPDSDEFFLTFELLGGHVNVVIEPAPLVPVPVDASPVSAIGLRTFDELNVTMSVVTSVPTTETNVKATYDTIRQQLPSIPSIETFAAAQEIAIAQLAIEYCNALVQDTSLRDAYFPDFNFNLSPAAAFAGTDRDDVLDPLIDNVMGIGILTQPDLADVKNELGYVVTADYTNLIDTLVATGGTSTQRTGDITKAVCAGVLGSAVTVVQ